MNIRTNSNNKITNIATQPTPRTAITIIYQNAAHAVKGIKSICHSPNKRTPHIHRQTFRCSRRSWFSLVFFSSSPSSRWIWTFGALSTRVYTECMIIYSVYIYSGAYQTPEANICAKFALQTRIVHLSPEIGAVRIRTHKSVTYQNILNETHDAERAWV